jgi:hypothetical protein
VGHRKVDALLEIIRGDYDCWPELLKGTSTTCGHWIITNPAVSSSEEFRSSHTRDRAGGVAIIAQTALSALADIEIYLKSAANQGCQFTNAFLCSRLYCSIGSACPKRANMSVAGSMLASKPCSIVPIQSGQFLKVSESPIIARNKKAQAGRRNHEGRCLEVGPRGGHHVLSGCSSIPNLSSHKVDRRQPFAGLPVVVLSGA